MRLFRGLNCLLICPVCLSDPSEKLLHDLVQHSIPFASQRGAQLMMGCSLSPELHTCFQKAHMLPLF